MDDEAQLALVFRAAVLASFADGKPDAEEIKAIRELVALHPAFEKLPSPRTQMVDLVKDLREKGMDPLLEELCRGITGREYQELAFKLCARVIVADGATAGEEAMLLGELQEQFGFSPDDVKRLLAER
jgi:tellurite resistance protein